MVKTSLRIDFVKYSRKLSDWSIYSENLRNVDDFLIHRRKQSFVTLKIPSKISTQKLGYCIIYSKYSLLKCEIFISIGSLYGVIAWVREVLKRAVVGDFSFGNLKRSHLQSKVESVCY